MADVRAIQRTTRQSPYKMRLVIDQIRGKNVNEALALLKFSKKHAAQADREGAQVGVANAETARARANEPLDVDTLFVQHADRQRGAEAQALHAGGHGRATPIEADEPRRDRGGARAVRTEPPRRSPDD